MQLDLMTQDEIEACREHFGFPCTMLQYEVIELSQHTLYLASYRFGKALEAFLKVIKQEILILTEPVVRFMSRVF